jgi:nicotinamide phosphoribosyltransferase
MNNIILDTDSYKASHFLQYPPGTTHVSSYIEPRGAAKDFRWFRDPEVVHFGLQYFIKKYLLTPITKGDIDAAADYFNEHGDPFNRAGWEYILQQHEGYLPIQIRGLPEGTLFPLSCCQTQVRNVDGKLPWLTSYMETALLRAVWYPSTVATLSRQIKLLIRKFLEETADNLDGLPFKLHDFGARGVSSKESAEIGGLAHLVNFKGTDTMSAIIAARRYYSENMAGFSIPAAEHSTITAWGKEHEIDAYANMVKQFGKPGRLFAVVSDSYDIYNAVDVLWGEKLKQQVIESGATLVIRPDSGDPVSVLHKVFKLLAKNFPTRLNNKGYRMLPPYLRVIQGDGVDFDSILTILEMLKQGQWSADNIAFGMGGALLQKVNRDTFKYAMKASAAQVDGSWRDVYKDPVTDSGKKSKRGILSVVDDGHGLLTVRKSDSILPDKMATIYDTGYLFQNYSLEEIRERAK